MRAASLKFANTMPTCTGRLSQAQACIGPQLRAADRAVTIYRGGSFVSMVDGRRQVVAVGVAAGRIE